MATLSYGVNHSVVKVLTNKSPRRFAKFSVYHEYPIDYVCHRFLTGEYIVAFVARNVLKIYCVDGPSKLKQVYRAVLWDLKKYPSWRCRCFTMNDTDVKYIIKDTDECFSFKIEDPSRHMYLGKRCGFVGFLDIPYPNESDDLIDGYSIVKGRPVFKTIYDAEFGGDIAWWGKYIIRHDIDPDAAHEYICSRVDHDVRCAISYEDGVRIFMTNGQSMKLELTGRFTYIKSAFKPRRWIGVIDEKYLYCTLVDDNDRDIDGTSWRDYMEFGDRSSDMSIITG